MKRNISYKSFFSLALVLILASPTFGIQRRPEAGDDPELAKKIRRFSATVLTADISKLSLNDRNALNKIIAAAKLMDPLFLRQVWSGNEDLYQKLLKDRTAVGRQRLHYFLINDGPWSRLDEDVPFIEGVPKEKPANANFYPNDMTKEEFSSCLTLQAEGSYEKAKAMLDTYGVIRPPMKAALDRLNNVPVDIEPIFPIAKLRAANELRGDPPK